MATIDRLKASQEALSLSVTALQTVVDGLPTNGQAFEDIATKIDSEKSRVDGIATKLSTFVPSQPV